MWFIALERRNPLKEWATYPSSEGTLSKPRNNVLLSFPEVVRSCGSLSCNVCGTLREVYAFSRRIRGSSWLETSFFLTNYIEEQFWGAFRWVEIVHSLQLAWRKLSVKRFQKLSWNDSRTLYFAKNFKNMLTFIHEICHLCLLGWIKVQELQPMDREWSPSSPFKSADHSLSVNCNSSFN